LNSQPTAGLAIFLGAALASAALGDERPPLPSGCAYEFTEEAALDLYHLYATSCDANAPAFRLEDLEVTIGAESAGMTSLGSFEAFVERLAASSFAWRLEPYERGVTVICARRTANEEPAVVIDLEYQPTRSPELADVQSMRLGEMEVPRNDFATFLEKMLEPANPAP
jgi:hypothetical protein